MFSLTSLIIGPLLIVFAIFSFLFATPIRRSMMFAIYQVVIFFCIAIIIAMGLAIK
jgi:hypothetical protein